MELDDKVDGLKSLFKECILCPRKCRVDRTAGEYGFCGLPAKIILDCSIVHHGEEPPLSGNKGAGTIFFSSCNLGCIYCQNYQISHHATGREMDSGELALIMLDLQNRGCHNVEPVTPTPQTPLIMEALVLARNRGLVIPFVYNCGGYEDPAVVEMLNDMVDIYLPDFKYGLEEDGVLFSKAPGYPEFALESIKEMVRQVGDELIVENNVARHGIIIRHLVLPGRMENSKRALDLIKKGISTNVPLSLMSQYTPVPKTRNIPDLNCRLTSIEYDEILDYAYHLGFENLFIQEVNDFEMAPDFKRENPFEN